MPDGQSLSGVAYRCASDPAGTWSDEVPLFGAGRFPQAPYNVTKVNLNTLDDSLRDVVAYSEPSALFKDSKLYMSLSAEAPDAPGHLILIVSAEENGRVFLLAVPGSKRLMHDGTLVIEFENLSGGKLRRDSTGKLIIHKRIQPQEAILSGPGAGQSAYHRFNVNGGIIFPQFNLSAYLEVFQLFNTRLKIIDDSTELR
jgi:hypothetical protein